MPARGSFHIQTLAAPAGWDSESESPGPTYAHWQVLRTLGVKTFQLQKGSSHGRAKILSKHECGFEATPCATVEPTLFYTSAVPLKRKPKDNSLTKSAVSPAQVTVALQRYLQWSQPWLEPRPSD